MNLGEFIKAKRLGSDISLRKFCEKLGLDPSNWSKVERGMLNLNLSDETKGAISQLLSLTKEETKQLNDLSILAAGIIPKEVYSDEEILNALPVLFRTASGERPTPKQKEKLIELIKKM